MQFKKEELVTREIEIAGYLLKNLSLKQIAKKTGLNKKHLQAHLGNLMKKLQADNFLNLKTRLSQNGIAAGKQQ